MNSRIRLPIQHSSLRFVHLLRGIAVAAIASLSLLAADSHAAPFTITFDGTTVTSNVGGSNAFTLTLSLDNGGTDTINQVWNENDLVTDPTLTSGTYSVTYDDLVITAFSIQTGAAGEFTSSILGIFFGNGFADELHDVNDQNGDGASLALSTDAGSTNDLLDAATLATMEDSSVHTGLTIVPEPTTALLLASSLAALAVGRRHRGL